MKQYLESLQHILNTGEDVSDRTGTGTRTVFGHQMRFDLRDGFPAVTTKRLAWRSVVSELLWFLEGSRNERRLAEIHYDDTKDNLIGKKTIWTANADAQGVALGHFNSDINKDLGPVYGKQWRDFGGVDQIDIILDQIKNDPDSRRIILSAWNVPDIPVMALPPCHTMAQFRVINGRLSCQLYQRSGDAGLGIPFNIASYALLTHIIARECGIGVGDFVHTIGDLHIYENHIPAIREQLKRTPSNLPTLVIDKSFDLEMGLRNGFDFGATKMFSLEGYDPHPNIKMDMAV